MELSLLPIEAAPKEPTDPTSAALPGSTESAAIAAPLATSAVLDRSADRAAVEAPALAETAAEAPAATETDRHLAAATREYESGKVDRPLWERAVELAGGDHAAAVPGYLRARATALRLAGPSRAPSRAGNRKPAATSEPAADAAIGDAGSAAATRRRRRSSKLRGWPIAAIGAGVAVVAAVWLLTAPRNEAGVPTPASPQAGATVAAAAANATRPPAPATPEVDVTAEREAKVQDLLRAGNWNVLVLHATEWTRKEPENARAWKHLSVGFANLRQHEDAVAAAEKAAQLAPGDRDYWTNLGRLAVAAKRPETALGAFDRAVELDPQDVASLVAAGRLQTELGRPAQAKLSLDRASTLAANDPEVLCAQAQNAQSQGRGKDAEAMARELRRMAKECNLGDALPGSVPVATPTTTPNSASPRVR